ncbi:MAG: bifunctional DNA primase/polymerase [Planctomycetes bacterium]|nr:bifunctional DNA primase/polymerase [Planctomycetota bacterium]
MTTPHNHNLLDAARWYLSLGYQPIPLPAGEKAPKLRGWTKLRLAEPDLPAYFNGIGNIGLLLGEPSGWLVDVDLDCPEAIELAPQFLPPTGAKTGRASARASHWWYVCEGAITKKHCFPGSKDTVAEIRSTGAQTAVGPSVHPSGEQYEPLEGDPARIDAGTLADAVQALVAAVIAKRDGRSERPRSQPDPLETPTFIASDAVLRRATAYLDRIPPAISGSGGHGQTYAAATALVHGFGLDPEAAFSLLWERYNPRCEPPWSEKELRHKVTDAASKTHDRPFGWLRDSGPAEASDVDLSGLVLRGRAPVANAPPTAPDDPGLLPPEALRVPGFVGEVMDYCLATAPYPSQTLAFCGALALQAFLAGRKVRDPGDNRTNMYLLGLAHSSSGKDWPRKINARVLQAVSLGTGLGDRLASGEGVQDAMQSTPTMLFQTDEIDGLLQSINRARDARFESIMGTLLTMYSASNSIFPMRRKAGQNEPGVIDQPCLVLFGTAIPNHYYSALSERMLTNGLFARMLILEAGPRGAGQEPTVSDLPERVLATAKWWADLRPGTGNLANAHPTARVVPHTDEARALLVELRKAAEQAYGEAEGRRDAVATTVWGRASEQTRKLALIYAVSENHAEPAIGVEAVRWASRLVMHQTRRMLFMAANHAAETPFDEIALRAMRKIREAPEGSLPHSVLLKRMKMDSRSFHDLIDTLVQRGDVLAESAATTGRAALIYRLAEKEGEGRVKEEGSKSGF